MHGTGYWWHSDVNDKLFEKKNAFKCLTGFVQENFSSHPKIDF